MFPSIAGRPLIGVGRVHPAPGVNPLSREAVLGSGPPVVRPASQHNGCSTPSISTQFLKSSLAPFVHRRKPHGKEELEPQCANIPSPTHLPYSSVSSQSLLVVCLNGGWRSTHALLVVSSSTYRRPLTDYSCTSLFSLLSQSHGINARCWQPQSASRRIGPCEGFGRRTQWKYSHLQSLDV